MRLLPCRNGSLLCLLAVGLVTLAGVELTLWQMLGASPQFVDLPQKTPDHLGADVGLPHLRQLRSKQQASAGGAASATPAAAAPAAAAADAAQKGGGRGGNLLSAAKRLAAAQEAEQRRGAGRLRRVGGAPPVPPLSEPGDNTTIFVLLSAFEDGQRCARTMARALSKAKVPERVAFSVLQAREEHDPDCANIFKTEYLPGLCKSGGSLAQRLAYGGDASEANCRRRILERSRMYVIDPGSGKGPAHQRGVASYLFRYETPDDMCLSMDSHMDFKPNWDYRIIADWFSTRNEFAVLTAYPADVPQLNHEGYFVDLCGYSLEGGIPRGRGGGDVPWTRTNAPYLTMNWAAGLSFHRCHMENNVPVDRYLRWIFTGEEIDRAVRLFTHGYDLYLPTNMVVLHEYAHAQQSFWTYSGKDDRMKMEETSRKRLNHLLENGRDLPGRQSENVDWHGLGLGSQRTLQDFVDWSRVDLGGKWGSYLRQKYGNDIVWDRHDWCRTLQRRPVKSEASLVAAALQQPRSSADLPAPGIEVSIPGEPADVRPKRLQL